MKRKILSLILINLFFISAYSQTFNPPIPVEWVIGNNRTSFQVGPNRNIYKQINFSNITSATADYKNTPTETELVMNNTVAYQFHKNLNIGAGLQYHYKRGLVPNISMTYTFISPAFIILISPAFQLLPNGEKNLEFISFAEFKPKLTEKIRLYTKAQYMYNHSFTFDAHDRSFAYFRLGLKINIISFGGACNLDYYGKDKFFKENYGGFIKFDI